MKLFDFLASCDPNTNLLIYETDYDVFHEGKASCMFSEWTYENFGTLMIESVSIKNKDNASYIRVDVFNKLDYHI